MAITTRALIRALSLPKRITYTFKLSDGEMAELEFFAGTITQFRRWYPGTLADGHERKNLGPLVIAFRLLMPEWKTPELPPAWMTDWSQPAPDRDNDQVGGAA